VKVIWHHVMVESDEWGHVFGRPTDCYCEPEVDIIDGVHRVVRHQDMSGKEVSNGTRR
jgi:hypothetical protein